MTHPSRWIATLVALSPFATLPAQEAPAREFPEDWFWHKTDDQWAWHAELLGKPMPTLDLSHWHNGEVDLDRDLRGKVVVVDFWATWCGPCIRSIPHNNELWKRHKDDGLVFLGICGSNRGQDLLPKMVETHGIEYPVARDAAEKSGPAWHVMWWPTYAVVDRRGMVRALGLKPEHVGDVVERLLAEPAPGDADGRGVEVRQGAAAKATAPAAAPAPVPAAWLEKNPARDGLLARLTGQSAPALQVDGWHNAAALGLPADTAPTLAALRGKVVLLDFWATWCGPCIRSIPHTNELQAKYRDRGLCVVGVCHPKQGSQMVEKAEAHGIEYAVALDGDGATIAAFGVNSYPDYYLIDRHGRVRVADCNNDAVEAAIELLLAEPAPAAPDAPDAPANEAK